MCHGCVDSRMNRLLLAAMQITKMRHQAATRIQAVVRAVLAREHTDKLLRHLKAQARMRHRKAVIIQTLFRGYQQRCWYLAVKAAELQRTRYTHQCASRIQKNWRIWKTRQIVNRMRSEERRVGKECVRKCRSRW